MRAVLVVLVLAALVPLAACGKRGGPVPPGPANVAREAARWRRELGA